MTDVKTFDECIAITGTAKKHLMLGNGFSIALFPKIFNYKTLAENIESERINLLFKAIDTNDFEFVMRRLLEAAGIVQHYDSSEVITERIHEDIEGLKRTLIQVITKCHPPKPSEITEHQYNSCRNFLLNFVGGKTYTFNYDLILYWVLMHFHEDKALKLPCDDGFRYRYSDEFVSDEERDTSLHWEIGQKEIKVHIIFMVRCISLVMVLISKNYLTQMLVCHWLFKLKNQLKKIDFSIHIRRNNRA